FTLIFHTARRAEPWMTQMPNDGPDLIMSPAVIPLYRLNGYRELDSVCTRRTGVTVYVRGI
ncbi:TPA: hypothetical protein ACRGFI_005015, partial [Klebsiella pneumoniae]